MPVDSGTKGSETLSLARTNVNPPQPTSRASGMFKLVIEDDEGKRTVVPLTRGEYSIGRKQGNTIRLTERNVSREHVRLVKKNGASKEHFVLEDLKSYNGVFVNGLRVAEETELSHGDLVQVGDYRILYQDEAEQEKPAAPADTPDAKTTIPIGQMARGSTLMERPDRFVMLVGPTPGVEYPLDKERMTIGRAEDASISVNHNSVSRLHCEVHALGEGRYEIVDKGSANGVRVNSSDLKRGIIEAGDLIELGDVRFKFVAAGQVFVPAPNEKQELIADREAPDPVPPKPASTGLYVAAAAVLGIAIVLVVWFLRHQGTDPGNNTPAPTGSGAGHSQLSQEQAVLEAAKQLCKPDDCDAAHAKLMSEVREDSTLRASTMFRDIEKTWAQSLIDRADREADTAKKRSLLLLVAQTNTVELSQRNIAQSKLKELDSEPAPTGSAAPEAADAASTTAPPTSTAATPSATGQAAPPAPTATGPNGKPTATTPTGKPAASASAAPAAASDFEAAQKAIIESNPQKAKTILWGKMQRGGKMSYDEMNLLLETCHIVKDKACLTSACTKLPTHRRCAAP